MSAAPLGDGSKPDLRVVHGQGDAAEAARQELQRLRSEAPSPDAIERMILEANPDGLTYRDDMDAIAPIVRTIGHAIGRYMAANGIKPSKPEADTAMLRDLLQRVTGGRGKGPSKEVLNGCIEAGAAETLAVMAPLQEAILDAEKELAIEEAARRAERAQKREARRLEEARKAAKFGDEPICLPLPQSDYLELATDAVFGGSDWTHIGGILHVYNGTHYEPVSDEQIGPRVATFLERLYYVEMIGETQIDVHKWARPGCVREVIQWFKGKLGACHDYDLPGTINCANGALILTWDGAKLIRTLEPHNSAQRFTSCLPYEYNPEAPTESLDKLLEALDDEDREIMQRFLGSGFDLPRYRAKQGRPMAFLMIGDGSNGKDSIREALLKTLGASGMTGCTLGDFQQYDKGRKFPLAPLYGSRINWSAENTAFARLGSIQVLKNVISGEPIQQEKKNADEVTFTPNCICLFNCNEPPLFDGGQVAQETRWHAVRFNKTFVADPVRPGEVKADPRFKDDPDCARLPPQC
jgi:hypothetical protein